MSIFGSSSTTAPQTGGGLFGASNTQQQQQPTGGDLFGNPTQNPSQQASSLFGNTPQASQPSIFGNPSSTNASTSASGGGLFGGQSMGQNATQGATGGLFGGQQQSATGSGSNAFGGGQTQPSTTGGGLFGSTTQQPQAGGNIFGSTPQQQQQQQAGGGLFGLNTQQPAASGGGGLFGSTTQQPSSTGGGLFGTSTQQQPTTGGSFFGTNTQQHPTTGGSIFGPNTQQPAPAGGGLFGSTTQNQTTGGGGLFGSTSQQPATTGGGLFGSTSQQPSSTGGGLFGSSAQQHGQQQQGGSLFGGKPGLSLNTNVSSGGAASNMTNPFGGMSGQSQQQQPAVGGGLFSQQQQNQARPSSLFGSLGQSSTPNSNPLFGGGTSGGFGSGTLGVNTSGPAQQQADAQVQHARLLQRLEAIYSAWNPTSSLCRFQYPFYNLVRPEQVNQYRQPPNVSNELWQKAARENSDPTRMVPVIAVGFDDLRARVDAQTEQAEKHKQRLTELKQRINALSERHTLSNTPRLQRAASQQTQLTQRLTAFVQHLHLLLPAIRSSSIRPEEEQLRGQLEEIEEEVRRGRLKSKLNELWALISAINASERGHGANGSVTSVPSEWAVVDEDGFAQITQILTEQTHGLAYLTKMLQKHQKELDLITKGGSGDYVMSHSNDLDASSWGSRSTLHASALR